VILTRKVGLARALSKLGHCSRSQAADLIRAGRVRLNGTPRKDPETPVRLQRDRIEVDGHTVASASKIYLMLNKPRGLVTSAADEKGRDTVYSCLSEGLPWVGPVGRLDKASEGLLLLTNDSEWAARITDPQSHLDKTYHVQVGAQSHEGLEAALLKGVRTEKHELLRAKRAHIVRGGERNTWLEIVLDEGRNRQIRRIFDVLALEVLRLIRIAIGPIELGPLPKGQFRTITSDEKKALDGALRASRTKDVVR